MPVGATQVGLPGAVPGVVEKGGTGTDSGAVEGSTVA